MQFCPGVGPKRASLFAKLNINTVGDLFWHIPRGYEDFHTICPIRQLRPGQVGTVVGTVSQTECRVPRSASKVYNLLHVVLDDASGSLTAVWFNQPYLAEKIHRGTRLLVHGKVDVYDGYLQMNAPKHQIIEGPLETGILPLYPLTEGLTQAFVRKVVQAAFARYSSFCEENLPLSLLKKKQYPERKLAFRIMHQPAPGEGAPTEAPTPPGDPRQQKRGSGQRAFEGVGLPPTPWELARRRLVFEEFFIHQLVLRAYLGKSNTLTGISHPMPEPSPWGERCLLDVAEPRHWPAWFIWNLPYTLTDDQQTVCREFEANLHAAQPMNRLLQGDVGAGKTVVSFYAMMLAVAGGRQAVMMAPTELLAQQHAENLRRYADGIPRLQIEVLTGSQKTKERREVLERIATGTASIVVGTHALFQDDVQFARLGLVVVDEQHKFGVNQRQRLVAKGETPDLLVATATPIPRTLSLTLFGDMEVSTIRALPPGRPQLITRWTQWSKEEKVWEFIDGLIAQGQQVYVVCPIIEPSENAPHLPSTEEAFEKLSKTFLPHRRVAVLHGRQATDEKSALMQRMKAGAIDVVVATTVIEVGVDLPNATVMVVLGAERFGLAQLHQLRGRVGRGTKKSYCVLITPDRVGVIARQRMRCLEQTRDGFVIAEEDLKLRGPGEHFGTRQSGHLNFRLADPFEDSMLLHEAHQDAHAIYQRDPGLDDPEFITLKKELFRLYGDFIERRPS
jgi:ATP-dependent DNA helicase RecG